MKKLKRFWSTFILQFTFVFVQQHLKNFDAIFARLGFSVLLKLVFLTVISLVTNDEQEVTINLNRSALFLDEVLFDLFQQSLAEKVFFINATSLFATCHESVTQLSDSIITYPSHLQFVCTYISGPSFYD